MVVVLKMQKDSFRFYTQAIIRGSW